MKYGGTMCAYSCIIPSVYVNWTGMSNQQAMGHYLTITSMLISLGNALKDVILSYKEVRLDIDNLFLISSCRLLLLLLFLFVSYD
jgi:hypothetical protein